MKLCFAENLKYLRKLHNLTQMELALLFKKKHTTIGNWEKKISRPNIEELVELARHFHFNIDEFLLDDLRSKKGNSGNVKNVIDKQQNEKDLISCGKEVYSDQLIQSLQLNVQTMRDIIATKTAEIQQLQQDNIFLKQNGRKLRIEG